MSYSRNATFAIVLVELGSLINLIELIAKWQTKDLRKFSKQRGDLNMFLSKKSINISLYVLFMVIYINGHAQKLETKCHVPKNASGAISNVPAGCYDYFTFAQIWAAESHFASSKSGILTSDPIEQQQRIVGYKALAKQWAANQMTPHGLWPNFLRKKPTYPENCQTDEQFLFNTFPLELRREMEKLYPQVVFGLPEHEWSKHGTCTGWSAQHYFETIVKLNEQLATPPIITNNLGKTVSYQALLRAYGGNARHVFFSCDRIHKKQYLSQILTLWDKKLSPLSLPHYQAITPCQSDKPIYIRQLGPFITFEQLKNSLDGLPPLKIGFDIDDTLLFSSASFYYAGNHFKPNSHKYWQFVNTSDGYSLPKQMGQNLINLHKERGDLIYIITARPRTSNETVGQTLKTTFDFEPAKLVFTNGHDKTPAIKQLEINLYYGDADSDITSAYQAGARPIRVERSPNSENTNSPYHPGGFAEDVLFDSAN